MKGRRCGSRAFDKSLSLSLVCVCVCMCVVVSCGAVGQAPFWDVV